MKQLLLKSKILLASLSVAATVGIVAVVVMLVSQNDEAYRTIKVIETFGEVNVIRQGGAYAAYSGMILEEGYELVTGDDSYVRMILDDDKYVKVEEGSKIAFETLGLIGSNKTTIRIEKGAMTCEIVKPLEGEDDFNVNTPNSVLAVRGTFFRVDLNYYGDGLVKTNVMTYGGKVAAQRVLSTGELVGTEVDVDAGNKVVISQVNEMEDNGNITEDVIFESQTITVEDIPNEDLVDVYFAIENGHKMFLDIEDVQDALDIREIDIEEHISVYEKAKKVDEDNIVDTSISEETSTLEEKSKEIESSGESITGDESSEETTTEAVSSDETTTEAASLEEVTTNATTAENNTSQLVTTEPTTVVNTSGQTISQDDTTTVERTTEETVTQSSSLQETTTLPKETTTENTTVLEETTTLPKETTTKSTTVSEEQTTLPTETTTEEITTEHIHTEVAGGESEIHKKCSECEEVIEDGSYHSYIGEEILAATCTGKGEIKYTCICGHTYAEEIDYLDHTGIAGGVEDIHKKCVSCGEILENGSFHEYEIAVTKTPTCTELGVRTYTCDCGYTYTEEIPMETHMEVAGGEAGVHKKCDVCGTVIEDGTYHHYTSEITIEATCTSKGEKTYSCTCGHSYTEEIDFHDHVGIAGAEIDIHEKCGNCGEILQNGSSHEYGVEETLSPTCIDSGIKTYMCSCGHTYTEEIPMLGHTSVAGGEEYIHEKCERCETTLQNEAGHDYDIQVTKTPSCTEAGIRTYTCDCGYTYTEEIPVEAHVEVAGGEAGVHKKCDVCGTVIEDGTYHYYTEEETVTATCTDKGEKIYSCTCGHSYTEEIAALGHTKSDPDASSTTCVNCGKPWVDISEVNFEDTTFRIKLGQFDINNDGCLIGEELTGITSVSVAGTTAMDGECKNLNGIELLPNVTQIDCSYNVDLLTLDFSDNTKLYKLYCNNTGVQSINISGCIGLSTFDFANCNELTELDVRGTTLTSLIVNSNPELATLNIEGATFSNISLSGTKITSLDIDGMNNLRSVTVTDTPIESVVINNSRIEGSLTLNAISQLQNVTVTNTEIYDIYVEGCSGLKTLSVDGTNGNVSFENSNNIETLKLSGVKLYSIELPGATYTKLKSLDVSDCDSLQTVDVSNCITLTSIDITNNTQLGKLIANNSGISSLDTTGCTYLSELYLNSTKIADVGDIIVPYEVLIAILEIGSDSSSDINLAFDSEDISWFDMIEVLDLTNAKISDSDWATIKNVLRADRIRSITLSENNSANSSDYLTKIDFSNLYNVTQVEVEELTDVTQINISNSGVGQIDISEFVNLTSFNAAGSALYGILDASSNEKLETIDISNCMSLEEFVMNRSDKAYALNSINIMGCSSMTQFVLGECANVTNIDFTELTKLSSVGLTNCPGITSVDFTDNSELTNVTLEGLGITYLDIFGKSELKTVNVALCTSLTGMDLRGTPLESLVLTGCTGLTTAGCVDVTDNESVSQSLEVDITGTSITEDIFEKSDGLIITLVTQ